MVGGKVIFHQTLCFTSEKNLFVKGVGCKASTNRKPRPCPYIDIFTIILNHLEFEGLCCFDFKAVDGELKIFELNPRYSGSLTRFLMPMMKAYSKALEMK